MEALIHMTQAFNCFKKWLNKRPKQTNKHYVGVIQLCCTILFSSELTYNIKNPSDGTISTTGQDSEIWNISKEI